MATSARTTGTSAGASVPDATSCSTVNARDRTTRRLISAQAPATGGSTACSRVPSGSRASTAGEASSSRCPPAAASRTARVADVVGTAEVHVGTRSSRPAPRSTQTSRGR